ncbi:hypothetical protein NMY22_g18432 [Coprinellus aureogranulatus]|nr:hypothetical protein NMY22_g18432 [Coprinellus aureogranulatus]
MTTVSYADTFLRDCEMAAPNGTSSVWSYLNKEQCRLTELGLPEDVLNVVKSTDPPSAEDLQRVEAALGVYRPKLDTIQDLIEAEPHLPSMSKSPIIESLWRAEALARNRVFACVNVRAAWRRVPVEIWDRIFSHVLDALRTGRSFIVKADVSNLCMNAPATISLVCKTWKAAVFATPSIWRDLIVLAKEDPVKAQPVIRVEDADLILGRLNRLASNSQRWDLTMMVADGPDEVKGVSVPLLLQCHPALPFVERLSFSASRFSGYLRGLPFPNVTSLTAFASRNIAFNENPLPHFPRLRKAVFVDVTGQHALHRHLPYLQLTHLFLGKIFGSSEMIFVLRQCPALRHGGFWLQGRTVVGLGLGPLQPPPPPAAKALVLPHLVELIIVNEYCPNLSFEGLTFPNLVRMKVYCEVSFAEGQLLAFPNVKHLTLHGSPMTRIHSSPGLRDVMQSCPFLTELTAPWLRDVDSLVYDPKQPTGQHLECLTLLHPGLMSSMSMSMFNVTVDPVTSTLLNIVDSRRKAPQEDLGGSCARLEQLTIRICDGTNRWDNESAFAEINLHAALQPHVDAGLKLSIVDAEKTELTGCPLSEKSDFKHWDFGLLDFLEE